jgi:hypothetical protein
MKIQKEFDPIQGTTTVRIEKTREDVTPVVTYKEFISKGIENADGEIVNQRLENVLPENVATTLFQETLSDGTDIKAAVAAVTAKATIEYAEKNGQRAVIEMKYRQPTGDAAEGTGTGRTVATPRITISTEGSVTITASEGDVFYTTNGSNPTSSSTAYTAAFTVADGTTVKAIAVVTEEDPETGDEVELVSSVATKKYTAASTPDPQPSGKFTVYYGSIYNTDPDDDKLATFATYTDEEFLAKVTGTDPDWGGDVETVQASTLRNFVIQLPVASHSEDAYMWKFVAAPKAKVPAGFTIVEEQTKGEQTPIMTRDVTIDGVVYTAFYGFTDTDLKIILDYHA